MTPETTQLLKVEIDSKVHFLAKLAARYKGATLENFVEDAVKAALTPEAVRSDEPTPGTEVTRKQQKPLWSESLWHEDEVVRLFNVALLDSNLLSRSQNRIFTVACAELAKQGKKVTLKNFVQFFDAKDGE